MTDFEEKIRQSKECIQEVETNSVKSIYEASMVPKRGLRLRNLFTKKLIIRYLIVAMIIGVSFTGGMLLSKPKVEEKIIYHQDENGDIIVNRVIDSNQKTPISFTQFSSEEELFEYLSQSKSQTSFNYRNTSSLIKGGIGYEQMPEYEAVEPDTVSPNQTNSGYKTNVTVENVDEADIVKVSGNHIFYLPSTNYNEDNKVHMLEENKDELTLIKTIEFVKTKEVLKTENGYNLLYVESERAQNLYVTDRYLIVQVSQESYKALQKADNKNSEFGLYDYINTCCFQVYDVKSLDLVTTIKTSGTNVSTRLVNNTLYVVNNYYDYLYTTNSIYFAPYYYVDGTFYSYRLGNIFCIKDGDLSQKGYVSIYKITLDEEVTISDLHILTPSVNNIYATEKNIYLLRTYSNELETKSDYQVSYNSSNVTVVNIEKDLELLGNFTVKGRIIDKYAISEKDDYIRVVTTGTETKQYYIDQKYVYKTDSSVFNHLTIFKKTSDGFVQTSAITDGLGEPGETVRSARFNDDMVTIVTFRNTDPLYYVDISDPEKPIITSSVKITGYSIYQHPYRDNIIIGFGYEADKDGRTTGYKITLFDASDKNNIKEIGMPYIISYSEYINSNSRSYINTPEFFNDPKALFVNMDRDIFGFRLTSCLYGNNNGKYYWEYQTNYLVFKIDLECKTPIQLILNEKTINDDGNYFSDYFERLVYINNNYYLLSGKVIHYYIFNGKEFEGQYKIPLE